MTTTPDTALAARLDHLMDTVKSARIDTDCGVSRFLNKRALYIEVLVAAHTSGQLITLAAHNDAVQAAVAKAVEACAVIAAEYMDWADNWGEYKNQKACYTCSAEIAAAIRARKGDAL